MVSRRLLSCLALLFLASSHLQAQLQVDLKFSRRLYMAYAPILASVSITNYSGRDLVLENTESQNWLSFQITNGEGTLVAARAGKTRFDPRTLQAGETCRFAVNLVNSYPVTEFGPYHIQANLYFAPMAKYFSSPRRSIEVSEGKVIWEQNLGVPEGEAAGGGERQVSLLTFRDSDDNDLYARVENREAGVVYMTQKLGRLVAQGLPQIEVDPDNKIHVLQLVSPKTYLYSSVGLNGTVGHLTYYEVKTRPKLRRLPDGNIGVAGGQIGTGASEPNAPGAGAPGAAGAETAKPKISDRPVELPPE
jgi:hypothetical protein